MELALRPGGAEPRTKYHQHIAPVERIVGCIQRSILIVDDSGLTRAKQKYGGSCILNYNRLFN